MKDNNVINILNEEQMEELLRETEGDLIREEKAILDNGEEKIIRVEETSEKSKQRKLEFLRRLKE